MYDDDVVRYGMTGVDVRCTTTGDVQVCTVSMTDVRYDDGVQATMMMMCWCVGLGAMCRASARAYDVR